MIIGKIQNNYCNTYIKDKNFNNGYKLIMLINNICLEIMIVCNYIFEMGNVFIDF